MKPAYLPFTCYHNCLFIFYPQAKFDQVPIFYQKRINSFGSSCSASKTKTLCKLWNPSSWDVHKRCQPLAPPRPQQVLANRKSQGARTEVSKSRPELGVCAAAAQIKARDQSEDTQVPQISARRAPRSSVPTIPGHLASVLPNVTREIPFKTWAPSNAFQSSDSRNSYTGLHVCMLMTITRYGFEPSCLILGQCSQSNEPPIISP